MINKLGPSLGSRNWLLLFPLPPPQWEEVRPRVASVKILRPNEESLAAVSGRFSRANKAKIGSTLSRQRPRLKGYHQALTEVTTTAAKTIVIDGDTYVRTGTMGKQSANATLYDAKHEKAHAIKECLMEW